MLQQTTRNVLLIIYCILVPYVLLFILSSDTGGSACAEVSRKRSVFCYLPVWLYSGVPTPFRGSTPYYIYRSNRLVWLSLVVPPDGSRGSYTR